MSCKKKSVRFAEHDQVIQLSDVDEDFESDSDLNFAQDHPGSPQECEKSMADIYFYPVPIFSPPQREPLAQFSPYIYSPAIHSCSGYHVYSGPSQSLQPSPSSPPSPPPYPFTPHHSPTSSATGSPPPPPYPYPYPTSYSCAYSPSCIVHSVPEKRRKKRGKRREPRREQREGHAG